MSRRLALAAIAVLAVGSPASAVVLPTPGSADGRIQTVVYAEDQVVQLTGQPGYQLMVEFAPEERIENVAVGDTSFWMVTPNKSANRLFIKPLGAYGTTNMTVVTDLRRYVFELTPSAGGPGPAPYVVRFDFPKPPASAAAQAAAIANHNYSTKGAAAVRPDRVFDDGRFTYFRWPEKSAIPAIFLLGADGGESLANYSVRGDEIVVELTAQRFRLRNGKSTAIVTNQAWNPRDQAGSAGQ